MLNCSNLIDTTSLENINYCEKECNSSIITTCFCKCLDENVNYVLYDSTIISYIVFPVLLFLLCICNINCFSIYNKRLSNSHNNSHEKLLSEYNDVVPVQLPPSYDSIIIDID